MLFSALSKIDFIVFIIPSETYVVRPGLTSTTVVSEKTGTFICELVVERYI